MLWKKFKERNRHESSTATKMFESETSMQVNLKSFLDGKCKGKRKCKNGLFSFSQSFFGRKLFIMCELSIQFRRMAGWLSIHLRKLKI